MPAHRRFKAICYVRCPSRLFIHLRIKQYSYNQPGSALHSSGVVMESNPCLSWAIYVYVQSSFLVQLVVGEAAITCYSPKSATSRPWFKKVCHRTSGVRRSRKGAVFSSCLLNHVIWVWDGIWAWAYMGLNRSLGLEFLDGKMLETISDAGGWLENLV